jgi:hypothetical protein
MVSVQGAETPEQAPDLAKPGVGGNAIGIVGSVGAFLSPRLSLAFESSLPQRFDAVQEIQYHFSAKYDNQHRDVILSGVFHFHYQQDRSVSPELVFGVGYVREDTLQRTAYQVGPAFPPTGLYGPYGPEISNTRDTLGAIGGVDVAIRVGAHVSVVPQARVYWIAREGTSGSLSWSLYLSPFVFRPAVGLRATF